MSAWELVYEGFDSRQQGLREALCTLSNGNFATRGAAEEAEADRTHYPGTYLAGGYNRLRTQIAGRAVENEDLVNIPNWLPLNFRPEGGHWLDLQAFDISSYRQVLDLRQGLLRRELRVRDPAGRETTLISRRLVHMGMPELAAIEWELRPDNWSGSIEVRSGIDGTVTNSGVARYRELAGDHLTGIVTEAVDHDSIRLVVETSQSHLRVAEVARTEVFDAAGPVQIDRQLLRSDSSIAQVLACPVTEGAAVRVEKVVGLSSSRNRAISDPDSAAAEAVRRAPCFAELVDTHKVAWSHLWNRCDLALEPDTGTQMIVRLHVFHILQTLSPHSVDLDVGVPARGWHGEAYRGHIFWDELFVFPFLNLRIPEITRACLRYRYRRLPKARDLARQAGYRGAMYPWQSGSSGREESQVVHLNPKSGRWVPDHTHLQRHVSSAIAYNVWRYFEATGDHAFMAFYGAEMLAEVARFWSSIATWSPVKQRYEIRGVMGPDEFHDGYPDTDKPGLDNNAYTSILAAWVLARAVDALDRVGSRRRTELQELLTLTDAEIAGWTTIGGALFVPFHSGVISQFEGYEQLEEFDWQAYRGKYGDIHRLDRILETEGDTVNRYKASKQADVLMLFYLFSVHELKSLFEQLGYPFDTGIISRSTRYYLERTSHGSTLSHIVHSWVLARSDRAHSWTLLEEALQSDVADIQGGTTPEGIHLGAMAGTVDLLQRGHIGLEVGENSFRINPRLPPELQGLRLRLRYRDCWLELEVGHEELTVAAPEYWTGPQQIYVGDRAYDFGSGTRLRLRWTQERGGWSPDPNF